MELLTFLIFLALARFEVLNPDCLFAVSSFEVLNPDLEVLNPDCLVAVPSFEVSILIVLDSVSQSILSIKSQQQQMPKKKKKNDFVSFHIRV